MFYRNAGSLCTGAIISKNVILTAAHCAKQDPWWWPTKLVKPSIVFVTFGHSDLGNAKNMSVKSILTHPNFQFPKNDVALLKLSNNLEFNDAVQPIFLPSSNATKYDLLFEELIFAGYGSEKVDTEGESAYCQYGELFIGKMFVWKVFICIYYTFSESRCTKDHPFAYFNGQYCCKTNQELVNGGTLNEVASGTCDGIGFSIESTCCKGNKYLKCPQKQCVTRH